MSAYDRLFAAGQRLVGDLSTGLMSQLEMFVDFGDVDGDGDKDMVDDVLGLMDHATKAFTVGMVVDSIQADTGVKGEVAVPVPESAAPLVLAACLAASVVPGELPGQPATPVTCPAEVPTGDRAIRVAIDPSGTPGLYFGHVSDQAGDLLRPFLIFLDGLT